MDLSPTQILFLTGQLADVRVFQCRGAVMVDFHCRDTNTARALWRRGVCSGDVRVRAGARRVELTPKGERVVCRLRIPKCAYPDDAFGEHDHSACEDALEERTEPCPDK